MIKIPKKFTYMGVHWTVDTTPFERSSKWGSTNFRDKVMSIDGGLSHELQEGTFIHELLHIILFQMGIDKALDFNDEKEEILANAMANGLFDLISSKVLNVQ